MMDEIMRQEERILLKEPLNKSSAAEQRIFFPIHAEWKTGNTRSIPLFSILLSEKKSLAVSSCRFNQSFLNQIAKLTEEGHLAWDCVAYNPIGFLDKDEYSEQSACICQMFQFEATIGGLPHELELAEYIHVPSGKMDLAVTLTRNDEEHFMKIDSILSVELDPYIKESLNKSSAAGKLIFFASHAE